MKSGSSFLLAARQTEIAELEQLAGMGRLVGAIARLIHALQRERGMVNVFLGSAGGRFAQRREQQAAECLELEHDVRARFDALDREGARLRHGARLFGRIALVVHALEGLPELRERIATHHVTAAEATDAYSLLVNGLLGVVFEAADASTDPEISRVLVAMFNFMQGKELAGQERAAGARAFAAGAIDLAGQQQWRHLIDAQQGNFQAFADFSDPDVLRADLASRDPVVLAELERLRRIGCAGRPGPLDPDLTHEWYDTATRRLDALRGVETFLAQHVHRLCESRVAEAKADLRDQRALLDELNAQPPGTTAPRPYGRIERSVLVLVQEQARRLQAMSDELDAVRAALNERKVVERAKGLLMAHRHMMEEEAYKALRQMAMNQNKRMVEVSEAVLSLADVLPSARATT